MHHNDLIESPQMHTTRTAAIPVSLSAADYRRATQACHVSAQLWNQATDWVHGKWKAGGNPSKYDIQRFPTSLSAHDRPIHAHTTEICAHDLSEAIKTSRAKRKKGIKVRSPWREKNYRPLSFTKGYGCRILRGKLRLSLGRGRSRIGLTMPVVWDSGTNEAVQAELWGEVQLCWNKDSRLWTLHIPYATSRAVSCGSNATAIDEGIINSMTLATWSDERTISVTVINGRGRATKRSRNKAVGSLQRKISRCKPGSKRHRRLVLAKKRVRSKAQRQLRDFCHQVSHEAANHVISNNTGRLIYGDVRGIEQKTRQRHSANRHQRQRLSQWSRGMQERYLNEKTGRKGAHLREDGSTKTYPKCLTRNRPSGRYYRCKNPECGFACHRDALGSINILQKAIQGTYVPIGTGTEICVTYLRAVVHWSPNQHTAHHKVQRRKARALSSAQNRALLRAIQMSKPTEAKSSTSSQEPDPMVVVA